MCFEPKMSASNSLLLKSIPGVVTLKPFGLKQTLLKITLTELNKPL
ncbi:hypothetical protein VCSRO140_2427 [Vibrio cholerae]|nr:hypothetical protein VCSRO140_2427 [Vibrio cholerae]